MGVVRHSPLRERVGLAIEAKDTAEGLRMVREAEAAGVRQVWTTMGGVGRVDPLTFYAAAALKTEEVRLGTSVLQIYPRHPIVTAMQALAIDDLAPGRLRLGLGPSHRKFMEGMYGLRMSAPLAYLREYVTVLRGALWDGKVDFHGKFFDATFNQLRRAKVPLLTSALGPKAFRLAGEISDGVISWMCPVRYLTDVALPALQAGAKATQRATPPLVAQVPVAVTPDLSAAKRAVAGRVGSYASMPFYASMFAKAGFPVETDGAGPGALAQSLAVAGDEEGVAQRLRALLAGGLDELLLTLVPVEDGARERAALLRTLDSL